MQQKITHMHRYHASIVIKTRTTNSFLIKLPRSWRCFLKNLHEWQKIYTNGGRTSCAKYQLCHGMRRESSSKTLTPVSLGVMISNFGVSALILASIIMVSIECMIYAASKRRHCPRFWCVVVTMPKINVFFQDSHHDLFLNLSDFSQQVQDFEDLVRAVVGLCTADEQERLREMEEWIVKVRICRKYSSENT